MSVVAEEDPDFFLLCIQSGYKAKQIFSTKEFRSFMKNLLLNCKNSHYIRYFIKFGFEIDSLKEEFENYLLLLLKNLKYYEFCSYIDIFKDGEFHQYISTEKAIVTIESNFMNPRVPEGLKKIVELTNYFEVLSKLKKSWIWSFVNKELSSNSKWEEIYNSPWMKHINVNCEEFDKILIEKFSISKLESLIRDLEYYPNRIFQQKEFDNQVKRILKINSDDYILKTLNSLKSFGYKLERIRNEELDSKFSHFFEKDLIVFSQSEIQKFHLEQINQKVEDSQSPNMDEEEIDFNQEFEFEIEEEELLDDYDSFGE
jgi:hypothetical protein